MRISNNQSVSFLLLILALVPTIRMQAAQKGKTTSDSVPPTEINFRLLSMSSGFTKGGNHWDAKNLETTDQIKVSLSTVYLDSHERVKQEYKSWLSRAVRIVAQGQIDEKNATNRVSKTDRAILIFPANHACQEPTIIIRTADTKLRIIESCSNEVAVEFEKQARQIENQGTKPFCSYMPNPPYSQEALREKFHGTVEVLGTITVEGKIDNIQFFTPPKFGLAEPIVKTMKTWKCKPATDQNGEPIPDTVTFDLNFILQP
jgi:Gram-negative bacterial TonB protein C-terminal